MDAQELHVLAVDDSYVDRKVIERLLKRNSCKVTLVESGMRALQYLGLDGEKKNSFEFSDLKVNLILTDYSMPEMTGYELLKKIKGSSAFNQIPVVVMSSENIVTRIDGCLEEGAEEFLMKPVQLSDVKRITDLVLNGGDDGNIMKETRKRKLCVCENLSSHAHKLSSSLSSTTLIRDIDVGQETLSTTLIRDIDVGQETSSTTLIRDIVGQDASSTTLIRDMDVGRETLSTLIRDIDVGQEASSTTLIRDMDVAQETSSTTLIRDMEVAQETSSILMRDIDVAQEA